MHAALSQYLWEDSMEIVTTQIWWRDDLISKFHAERGYDITPYIPLLYSNATAGFTIHYAAGVSFGFHRLLQCLRLTWVSSQLYN
jgi:hypothetical protein